MTLGCTRNEVDSEELAGRLSAGGWELVADAAEADVAVVNTCGFIEQAKKDSIDALLEASDLKSTGRTQAVVAVGCLAQRYGRELAAELPEADAVLGFDSYADLSEQLRAILDGARPQSHVPTDRRRLLPLTPATRQAAVATVAVPGLGQPGGWASGPHGSDLAGIAPASGPPVLRKRLDERPWAPLKIASGCDRRCAFCAIPAFRGAFVSRHPDEIVAEARWLADRGVKEVFLVSENSTSYGKDLGDVTALEKLLPRLSAVEGLDWVRVSYLQPAEIRPGLIEAMLGSEKVVPWFDISFQHAAGPLLRRMRRFGDAENFLTLLDRVRGLAPEAGIRSNVIVGFPGETPDDVAILQDFLIAARLDVVGVFGYSDEDGTEGIGLPGKVAQHEIDERVAQLQDLVEELTAQRAQERVGEAVQVLIEGFEDGMPFGRTAFQGPEIDGQTSVAAPGVPPVGSIVAAEITGSAGVDLEAIAR